MCDWRIHINLGGGKMERYFTIAILAFLASCTAYEYTDADRKLQERLSGKTLVAELATVTIKSDGTFDGLAGTKRDIELSGTWEIKNGHYCRKLDQQLKGVPVNQCQIVEFVSDNKVSFDGTKPDGRKAVIYTIE